MDYVAICAWGNFFICGYNALSAILLKRHAFLFDFKPASLDCPTHGQGAGPGGDPHLPSRS